MSTPAVTVHADATLAQAARIMAQRRSSDCPSSTTWACSQGIVSRADLLKVFLRDGRGHRGGGPPGGGGLPLPRLAAEPSA